MEIYIFRTGRTYPFLADTNTYELMAPLELSLFLPTSAVRSDGYKPLAVARVDRNSAENIPSRAQRAVQ